MNVAQPPTLATTSTTPISPQLNLSRYQHHENAKANLSVVTTGISTSFYNIFGYEPESTVVFEAMMANLDLWESSPVIEKRTSTRKSVGFHELPQKYYHGSKDLESTSGSGVRGVLVEPKKRAHRRLFSKSRPFSVSDVLDFTRRVSRYSLERAISTRRRVSSAECKNT